MGVLGTASRVVLGLWLVGEVAVGHATGTFRLLPWVLGLLALPAALLVWHWSRARRHRGRLVATGAIAHSIQVILFVAMLVVPEYVPALWFTADTALLFYGSAMLFAAVLDQLDCEVLALSNRLLRREDRLGCMIFAPFDFVDRRLHRQGVGIGR